MHINPAKIDLGSIAAFLDKMAENSDNVYWLSSPDLKRVEYISPAYEKIWGRPRSELYREPELWITYLHPEDAQHHHPIHEMAAQLKEKGERARYHENYRIIRPNGEIRWIIDRGFPVYGEAGECCGITGVAIDITNEKMVEERLRLAKEKAEESNELKTKFIQNMQHDIRTPLAGVYSYMKLLSEEETDPEKKMHAKHMAASTAQLLNMCNELVDFEHIDYMGDAVKLEPVNLLRFLSRVIDLNKMAAHNRGLELKLAIDSAAPAMLKLDKKRLYRVLVNLMGNSLKFTDEGMVSLQVKLISITDNTAMVAFEVHDTGMGIPAEKISHIFDKFVRLNPSNEAKYKGSGLGLFYVKKFVEDMGGEINVESLEGQGSIFRVVLTLPIPDSHEKEEMAAHEIHSVDEAAVLHEIEKLPDARFNKKSELTTAETLPQSTAATTTNQPNVLMIEDDPILQMTIKQTFKNQGCNVVAVVESVTKACDAVKAQVYDLVVCDLGIVGGSGIDVMNWVKSDKSHPNQTTPFVVLTANNDDKMKQKALDSGFLGVFQKPLETEDAKRMIETYLPKNTIQKNHTIMPPKTLDTQEKPGDIIIDLDKSLSRVHDVNELSEIFDILNQVIQEDEQKLKNYCANNDITATCRVLLRLDGTFRYCVVPSLEKARKQLFDAVKQTQQLTTLTALYNNFHTEVHRFLVEYNKLKQVGKL